MFNDITELFAYFDLSDTEFFASILDLKSRLKQDIQIVETSNDLEALPAVAQFWLAQKAELEFYKRGVEKEIRRVAGPSLVKIAKAPSYLSNRIVDIALQDNVEYSQLSDKLSRVQLVIDLLNSITTSLWFKRDSLVNLAIAQRKQLAYEQRDW